MDALWCGIPYLCLRLSNSGDALKFLIPSSVWKYISGWSNYPGMVTIQEILQRVMGYRGSKSIACQNSLTSHNGHVIVKEQRIDGSHKGVWTTSQKKNKHPMLRCVLMGLERDYHGIVLSESLSRCYSTSITSTDTSQIFESKLDPNFVSGFIDGEGSFSVTFIKDKSYKSGWQIKTSFSIGLHKKDLALLEKIKIYFGVGGISQKGVNGIQYYVNSPKDLLMIENHLDNYPLLTQKRVDFILFKSILGLIRCKEHLTLQGLNEIVAYKAAMNKGLPSSLKEAFLDIIPKDRPIN